MWWKYLEQNIYCANQVLIGKLVNVILVSHSKTSRRIKIRVPQCAFRLFTLTFECTLRYLSFHTCYNECTFSWSTTISKHSSSSLHATTMSFWKRKLCSKSNQAMVLLVTALHLSGGMSTAVCSFSRKKNMPRIMHHECRWMRIPIRLKHRQCERSVSLSVDFQ